MRLLNFAQPAFIMIGMYTSYFLWYYTGIDPFIGSILSLLIAYVIGYLLFRFLISRVLGHNELSQIFITVAILISLDSLALIMFGPATRSVKTIYQLHAFEILGITFNLGSALAFLIAL